jgi:hypothetical protein
MKFATQGTPVTLPLVKQVPEEVANVLAKSRGDLHLEGLQTLDHPGLANRLANRKDALVLPALTTLTPEAAKGFVGTSGSISLPALTTLDDECAKGFARHRGTLDFDTLEQISQEALAVLLTNRGTLELAALKTLGDPPSPEVLKALEKQDGMLSLTSVTSLHPDAAAAVRKRKAPVEFFGITTLTPDLAGALINCQTIISLPSVAELDSPTAQVLLTHRAKGSSGFLFPADLAGRLPAESAKTLQRHRGIHFGSVNGK